MSISHWMIAFASLSLLSNCAAPSTGTPPPSTPEGVSSLAGTSRDRDVSTAPSEFLGASARRWLVDVQITMRWAEQLTGALAHWWRSEALGHRHRRMVLAEQQIVDLAALYGVPRLARSWSAVEDPDHPRALRYDRIMNVAVRHAEQAVTQVDLVIEDILDNLRSASSRYEELASLLTSTTAVLESSS